jgi:hypothetical protein
MSEPLKLKIPEGVSSQGPVMDMAEAYTKAVVALPDILKDIGNSLGVLCAIAEKFAEKEGIDTGDLYDEKGN